MTITLREEHTALVDHPDRPESQDAPSPSRTAAVLDAAGADEYERAMHEVVGRLAHHLRTVSAPSSGPQRGALEAAVDAVELDTAGIGTREALREADALYAHNAVWFHHPAYMAHLNCPVVVPAVVAEAMLGAINTSVDTYDQSLAATLMEQRLIRWTVERIGFAEGDGVFTSGGTQSNLQALFLARERALRGLDGAARLDAQSRLRVLTSGQSHFSVVRSALLLGLPQDAVVEVDVDDSGRLDPAAVVRAIDAAEDEGQIVMALAATAGTTDRGAVDPIAELAEACALRSVWLHVDAAYGGGLLVSPRRRHLLEGIERADSVTIDFHKTFFQPVSSSAVILRDRTDLAAAAWHADYLNPRSEAESDQAEPNQVDKSLQTTRRFDALKLWVTLRALGPQRLGEMVDAVCDLAADVHARLEQDPDFVVAAPSDLSTVLLRFQPAGLDARTAQRLVPEIRRILFRSGRAMVARTTIDGQAWLKLTLLNPESRTADVTAVLDLVRATARGLLAGAGMDLAAEGVR